MGVGYVLGINSCKAVDKKKDFHVVYKYNYSSYCLGPVINERRNRLIIYVINILL